MKTEGYKPDGESDTSSPPGGGSVVGLPSTRKPDAELAAEYKKRVIEALTPVCDVLTEANANGFRIAFQLGVDGLSRGIITSVEVLKVMK